ncbi:MAG: hypothetical protein R3301_06840 [Saprospiraceae bacterium]|nr:hypothetical protein [Saprospiraceae bacterium]
MLKRCLIGFAMIGVLGPALGQTVIQPKQIDYGLRGILYKEERAFDLQIHTNGIALGYTVGDIRKYYLTRYYHVNLGVLKHPKEYRQAVNFQGGNLLLKSSSAFAYGKQNNFIVARAGIGEKRYLSEKAKRKGVAVGINYEAGVSLGFLKPYYLNINRVEPTGEGSIVAEKYTEENAEIFLDANRIYGSASFFKGIDEITIQPGLHGKCGAHFSVGAFDEYVRALEVGVMFDLYFKRVPIMIIDNNLPFFLNAYATLQLGKRR